MKSIVLALLPVIASLCQAVEIDTSPYGDGVWAVEYDQSGNLVGEPKLLAPINSTQTSSSRVRRSVEGRDLPDPQVHCKGYNVNNGDFACAQAGFDNWADRGEYQNPNTHVWSTCGSAQAFFCTYSQTSRAWRSEYDTAVSLIGTACGGAGSGWVYTAHWDKSYGKDNAGVGNC